MKKIGFFGLGIIGTSLARNLMKAGYDLIVYNRTYSKSQILANEGARIAESLTDLVGQVEICCSCVTNSSALFQAFENIDSQVAWPKYWVDFSTISPSEALEINKRLKDKGVSFIDAPVTGGDIGARNGTLSIMVGATQQEFLDLLSIFQALGKTIVHVGGSGKGQLTKCVNQLMCAISIAAMSEGLFFAEKLGLDLEKTLQLVKGGAAGSWVLENYAPRLLRHEYGPGFYAKDQLKDLKFVISEKDKENLNLPVISLVTKLFDDFVETEGGLIGNHALIKHYYKK